MSSFTAGPSSSASPMPYSGAGRTSPSGDPAVVERACGRCRRFFDIDDRDAGDAWWLCPPCHVALFGTP